MRADTRNFCLVNQGSPRAIVMGLSGNPEELLHPTTVHQEKIPVIKRFSGGGTVIVDENTLFITFIFSKDLLSIAPFPESILRWSAHFYAKAWQIPHFQLQENDYCIADQKCGGNAQYIQKDRWLHHTSFLWDYEEKNMTHLLLPVKRPKYRQDRSHREFLTRLKEHAPDRYLLIEQVKKALAQEGLHVKPLYMTDLPLLSEFSPHRQSTHFVDV